MKKNKFKKAIIFDLDGTLVDLARPAKGFITRAELNALANMYRIGLITGASRNETFSVLKKLGIFECFDRDLIVVLEDTYASKDTGKPFFEIVGRLSGSRMAMIGDSMNDEIGAGKAGVPFIRVQKASNFSEKKECLQKAIREAEQTLNA